MQTCQIKTTLRALLAAVGAEFDKTVVSDAEVSAVVCDSRKVIPGAVFAAIRGTASDGHAFAERALADGAAAVLTETRGFLPGRPVARVADTREAYARLNHLLHGEPSSGMKTLAVTGTNGKTTTAYLTHHLLGRLLRPSTSASGVASSSARPFRPVLLGTIRYAFEDQALPSTHTTPDPDVLQPWLAKMAARGADSLVMEASSHALDQDRLAGMDFDGVLFTNLTQDHLDYHGTFENYLAAKQKLFSMIRPGGLAIVNADDPAAFRILSAVRGRTLTFRVRPTNASPDPDGSCDWLATVVESNLKGSEFIVRQEGREHRVRTELLGLHNIYNVLGALGLAYAAGIPLEKSIPALTDFCGVPGRLERVPNEQGFELFIDYAHTPDGIDNVLSAVRPYVRRKLLVLFGCGGDRDRTKRPKMAAAVERYADRIVLTSDNPRTENPREIIREIQGGFSAAGAAKADIQVDRARAIRQILLEARPDDVVLLLGKGHEEMQIIGAEKIPFSDREEAKKALKGR